MTKETNILVSTQWLNDHLGAPQVKILDASWYLPNENRNGNSEYLRNHIKGAEFFDIDAFSDPNSELPHMVPSVEQFRSKLSKIGIENSHQVIIYDGAGLFSAARAWWLFKLFGVADVSVLDGGFPKWALENRPVTSEIKRSNDSKVLVKMDSSVLSDWKRVKRMAIENPKQIVDARPEARFYGKAPEPRPGLRSGHIPGSTNICYKDLLNDDKTMKDISSLRQIFNEKGVKIDRPIITSCGSGITAAIIFLALELLGAKELALYDGSWAEWGARADLDVEI